MHITSNRVTYVTYEGKPFRNPDGSRVLWLSVRVENDNKAYKHHKYDLNRYFLQIAV